MLNVKITVVVFPNELRTRSKGRMGTRYKHTMYNRLVSFNDEQIDETVGSEATITVTYRQPTQEEYSRALNELNRLLEDVNALYDNVIP